MKKELYAITKVLLLSVAHGRSDREVTLRTQWLEATPNHPMVTTLGDKKAGELIEGDKLLCPDQKTGRTVKVHGLGKDGVCRWYATGVQYRGQRREHFYHE